MTSSAVSPAAFAEWAWRIPFIASAALVAVGLWVRMGLAESPIFAQIVKAQSARRMPIVDVLRHDARAVMLAAGSYIGISTLGYIVIVYFVSYATRELKFPLTTTLALLLIAAVMFAGRSRLRGPVRSLRTTANHAVGKRRARAVVARVLSVGGYPIGSSGRHRTLRNPRHSGGLHRSATGRVLRAVPDGHALQRRVAEPDARHDSRRRALPRHRHVALQHDRRLHAHHRLHHGDVAHLVAVDAGPDGDPGTVSVRCENDGNAGGRSARPS